MSAQSDGGPAFPVGADVQFLGTPDERLMNDPSDGMSLRDYFAGQAMTLFQQDRCGLEALIRGESPRYEITTKFCYDFADAMLAERERREKEGA